MKWYLAKLVFRIICGEGDHTPQFEDQLRIFYAKDEMHAFYKARKAGEEEPEIVVADDDLRTVTWIFIDVAELMELESFSDGLEIFSRTYEMENSDSFIEMIRENGKRLYENRADKPSLMN